MEEKSLPLQLCNIKTVGDQGIIEGWASVFGGKPDSYGDIVVKGAFADSIKSRTPKFLWQHDMSTPIGKTLSLEETEYGLYGKWQLAKTKAATDAYELIREQLTDGLSIGYFTKESDFDKDGNRLLQKLDLLEVSAVTIGANDRALITAFKSIPTHKLLEQAISVVRETVREVEARHERRVAEHRWLNDAHVAEFGVLAREAEALAEKLARPVVLPDAEALAAEMELLQMRARLLRARRRTA